VRRASAGGRVLGRGGDGTNRVFRSLELAYSLFIVVTVLVDFVMETKLEKQSTQEGYPEKMR